MTNKNKYDILIQSIEKEWQTMDHRSLYLGKWEIPKYSRSQIEKAGKILSNSNSTKEEEEHALMVLNNWRASHAYPLHIIANNLRRKNPNAIVVQRLKRLDSITAKLQRLKSTNLYKMQDIGGCRVIVDSISDVYESLNRYKGSSIRHQEIRHKDYISEPKESGYRSYHAIYKFHSDKHEIYNKNMLIEIQFRTQIQHIWATAVEIMGLSIRTNLKASIGDKETLRFFTLVSSLFALMEKNSYMS